MYFRLRHKWLLLQLALLAISAIFCSSAWAQSNNLQSMDTLPLPKSGYFFLGVSGFLPFSSSYRLNYSTSLAGLPIEVNGGVSFPITATLSVPFTVRYIRRVVDFVPDMDLKEISIEPGVRAFLEKYEPKEFRFYGGASLVLDEATVSAQYALSQNGTVTGIATAKKEYFNLGLGFDLGLTYQLTPMTAIDFGAHLAVLFLDPISHGGLGDIGGVSLGGEYRFGF